MIYFIVGDDMKNINNKGFTLVELLATMSILSVIMILAVPNVVGIVARNKNKTYIEDAKKLVSISKYKMKSDSSVKEILSKNNPVCLSLQYLDAGKELNDAPNGGTYNNNSYVRIVKDSSGKYTYTVQLLETPSGTTTYSGIKAIDSNTLNNSTTASKSDSIVSSNVIPTSCSGTKF